ncbi:DUF1801 domain-containing protein [Aliikangiella sp. IMCC44632]
MQKQKISSVQEYIQQHPNWNTELSLLINLINQTKLSPTIKWGAPVYTFANANVVGLSAFKNHLALFFFQGALLTDSKQRLVNAQQGKTKAMRQWRFKSAEEINAFSQEILLYLNEAQTNQQKGRKANVTAQTEALLLAPQLEQALSSNLALKAQFEAFPPYKQKEFRQFILSAKRDTTKLSRLKKSIELISAQTGLNDKYRKC